MTDIDRNWITYMSGIVIVIAVLLWRFRNIKIAVTAHKPIEQDKIAQMIHSEPFALNTSICLNIEGKIIGVNTRAIKMFGWKEEELKGKGMDKIILPEYMNTYETYRIENANADCTPEIKGKNKAGETLDLIICIGKWMADLEWYYTVDIRDITHRKKNEEAVRLMQLEVNYLRELYHEGEKAGNVAFWKLDCRTGQLNPVSHNFTHLFGISGKEFQVEKLIKRVVDEDKIKVSSIMNMAKDNKTGYDMEYRMNGWDGYINTLQSTAVAYKDSDGELSHYIGMARLVKKEKQIWE